MNTPYLNKIIKLLPDQLLTYEELNHCFIEVCQLKTYIAKLEAAKVEANTIIQNVADNLVTNGDVDYSAPEWLKKFGGVK
jgi:hypothetical protein